MDAKLLFSAAMVVAIAPLGAQDEQWDLPKGGLSCLAIARLKSAGLPVVPLLRRVGLTPEPIAEPEERLSVRSQIALLNEAVPVA